MATRIILGIDPGLQHTGWGIISQTGNNLSYIDSGSIHSNSKAALAERLFDLHGQLMQVLSLHVIHQAAIEETFVNKNALSSLKLGHARGTLMTCVMQANIPLYEYASTQVKKSVVGAGRADKDQIMQMVKLLLPKSTPSSYDEADALAIAITHAHQTQHMELIEA